MELLSNKKSFKIDDICRLCLEKDAKLNNIYTLKIEDENFRTILSSLSDLPVNELDGLPNNVCDNCKDTIQSYYKFKLKIIKSYNILCDSILNHKSNAIDIENVFIKQEPEFVQSNDKEIDKNDKDVLKDDNIDKIVSNLRTQKAKKRNSDDFSDKFSAVFQKLHKNRNKCPLCLEQLDQNDDMVNHFYKHYQDCNLIPLIVDGKKTKSCNLCNKVFRYNTMVPHHRSHLKIYPFKCGVDDCDQKFVSAQYVKAHLHKHTGLKKYQCKTCGKTFGLRSSLTNHEETHKIEEAQCKICHKTYKNTIMLKIHMKRHSNGLKYKCEYPGCSKAFSVIRELNRHRRIHSNIKNYICNICSKAWYTAAELERHQRYHLTIKQHKCSHCEKSFVEKSQLKMHEMGHRGERPYICEFCSFSFIARNKLKRHQDRYCKGAKVTFEKINDK